MRSSVVHQSNQNQQVLYQNVSATSYFVSGEQLNVTASFPDTFGQPDTNGIGQPFCTNCEFIKWGAWGARVEFGNGGDDDPKYVDNIHLGWWVAGDPADKADIDSLAAQGATATYNGHVIGDVANNLDSDTWKTYVAAGDLEMNWFFEQRAGDLTISNFDGRSYGTGELGLTQPSLDINRFTGSLTQFNGLQLTNLSGNATGSFFHRPQSPAQGVGGNFHLRANDYKATGIFAGSGMPIPQAPN